MNYTKKEKTRNYLINELYENLTPAKILYSSIEELTKLKQDIRFKTAFNKEWRKIRNKAGLKGFKFHGLRHTVCTRLVKQNIPLPIVKEIMAHSDIKTTMRYTHVDSLDMINAMSVLDLYN